MVGRVRVLVLRARLGGRSRGGQRKRHDGKCDHLGHVILRMGWVVRPLRRLKHHVGAGVPALQQSPGMRIGNGSEKCPQTLENGDRMRKQSHIRASGVTICVAKPLPPAHESLVALRKNVDS